MMPGGARVDRNRLERTLDAAAGDSRTGATELVLRVADALAAWGRAHPDAAPHEAEDVVRRLIRLRPSMGPFLRLADAAAGTLDTCTDAGPAEAIASAAAAFADETRTSTDRIVEHVLASPPEESRLATYSAGSTIRAVVLALHRAGRPVSVLLSEARPAGEGIVLAEELAGAGVPIRLVSDAALPGALEGTPALWLGADALIPGGLVHKVGTAPLARAARQVGTRVVVLTGRAKMLGPGLADLLHLEEGDPAAVYGGRSAGIAPSNPLFDLTPWELIHTVISEAGPATPDRILAELRAYHPSGALRRLAGARAE